MIKKEKNGRLEKGNSGGYMNKYLNKLVKSHEKLLRDYSEIKKKFQKIPDSILKRVLGDHYSLVGELKKYGDGYHLRGLPKNTKIWNDAQLVIVVFIMDFPYLCRKSVFDPYCSITRIPYWTEKGLENTIRTSSGEYQIQYLVFEQKTGIHRKSSSNAKRNEKILNSQGVHFNNAYEDSLSFLKDLLEPRASKNQRVIFFTNSRNKKFNDSVNELLEHKAIVREKTNLSAKKNKKIMVKIQQIIEEDNRIQEETVPEVNTGIKSVEVDKDELIRRKYGFSGESPGHKRLKEWISNHPEEIDIRGVRKKKEEYKFFYTSDAADVHLELENGKYVVVEVETTNPLPGAFQALKYKVLKCAELGEDINPPDVEAILVAWAIPQEVKDFCHKYKIRFVEKNL